MNKRLIMTLSFAAMLATAMAVPAKRGVWKTVTLQDGTQVRVELRGDEHLSFWQAEDGKRYVKLADSECYALADMAALQKQAQQSREAAPLRSPSRVDIGGSHPDFVGKKKGLIVLAQFTDVKFQDGHDAEYYSHVANDEGFTSADGHVGSIHDYFYAQSYGQFDLTFDVVGPIDLKYSQSYYGGNSPWRDYRASEMIREAVDAAYKELGSFVDYDWFGSGYVDQVFVVYAGRGEADGGDENTIWPHRSSLYPVKNYGTKRMSVYACSNEMQSDTQIDGIGAFCHEFSHCLGLPDLYDTSYSGNYGMSYWDIMEGGCYLGSSFRPCGYSGYERNYCGWKQPVYLSNDTTVTDMKGIADGGDYYIIKNDAYANEYYILENRTKSGWDADLFGSGLLITHIDFDQSLWSSNMVNTTDGSTNDHQRYAIMPADGNTVESVDGIAGDAFPYNKNNLLTNYSDPAATLYHANTDGAYYMSKPITNITKASDGTISFNFANEVGAEPDPLPEGCFFRETFNYCNGDGGNDGTWNTSESNMGSFMTDNQGWEVSSANGGDSCAIIGSSSKKGTATTPSITISEAATLTFKAARHTSSTAALTLSVAEGDVNISESSFTMQSSQWNDYTVSLTADTYPATFKLTFANARRRFYLDEIYVNATSTSGISSVSAAKQSATGRIYSLDGRYMGRDASALQHGIYVKDGHKFVK